MIYPTLTPENVTRDFIDVFGGYNHNARINDNEFYDMENMSSSNYPLLSTRRKRGTTKAALLGGTVGILYASDLFFIRQSENTVYVYKRSDEDTEDEDPIAEYTTTIASSTPRNLIMMGAYLIIFPDKYYVNTVNAEDKGFIENTTTTSGSVTLQACDSDGNPIELDRIDTAPPLAPTDGFVWLDTSVDPPILKTFYSSNEMWVANENKYFRIGVPNLIAAGFDEGDGVKIAGIEEIPEDSYPVIHKIILNGEYNKYIVFKGQSNINPNLQSYTAASAVMPPTQDIPIEGDVQYGLDDSRLVNKEYIFEGKKIDCTHNTESVYDSESQKWITTLHFRQILSRIDPGDKVYITLAYSKTISTAITISRTIPDMDYVIESKNRLWGCRYGDQSGKFVNEIYCSKLGDFKNWSCYEGISTDSYAASCGSDGKWTGAISFNGYPLFFKENHIHTVRGDYPPYSISDNIARGVKDGSSQSLAIINEALYYHSTDGICAYQGGLPTKISSAFGDKSYKNASAVGFKNKYYCLMQDESTKEQVIMVYDVSRGLWHKESGVESVIPITAIKDDIIYAIVNASELFEPRSFIGAEKEVERDFEWFVETGLYGLSMIDSKYISRINIRLSIDVGAELIVSIEYDSSGEWERLCTIHRTDTRTFTLPIKPRRCDHFRLRLEGNGHTKIYSISKTIEQGSDKVYG